MTDPLGAPSGATGTGQSAGTGDQGAATAANAGGQSATGATATTPTDGGQSTVTRQEFDALRAQLAAADQKRTKAEQELAQLRDKDMPEMQRLQRDLQTSQAALAERDALIQQQRVELAFFTDNTKDWHSPSAAIQLLDRSKIQVDSEGKVVGMKDALEALAKAHPYLLKPAPADGQGTPPASPPAPGTAPANGGIGPQQGAKPDTAALAAKFPALRQRLG